MPFTPLQRAAGLFAWMFISLAFCVSCVALYAMRVTGEGAWLIQADLPLWTPTETVVTWAWLAFFVLGACGAWRVWIDREEPASRLAVKFLLAAWGLVLLWHVIWFGFMNAYCGAIQGVVAWMTFMAAMALAWQRSRLAGALLTPGLLWLTISCYLNLAIWHLNT